MNESDCLFCGENQNVFIKELQNKGLFFPIPICKKCDSKHSLKLTHKFVNNTLFADIEVTIIN